MSVTAPVCQLERSELKALAKVNTVEKEGERRNSFQTYHYNLLWYMSVTAPVFQFRGWLKALACLNTVKKKVVREETVFKHHHYNLLKDMSVTWEVSQLERSWLKAVAPPNTGKRRW